MASDGSRQQAEETAFSVAFRTAAEQALDLKLESAGLRPRGIIIPAGGARMFTCAWVVVRMLRDVLKTTLPIQVWHIGPGEMSPAMAALMAAQGVETVDALTLAASEEEVAELGGFELKSFALLKCAFRDVILLDADNVPLIDPEVLLDHEAFRTAGAIFWPDLVALSKSSGIWDLCGVAYRQMPSFESGQLVVDRERHFPALALTWFLNRHAHLVYRHVYGDKDTFMISWLALGAPFHLVSHPVRRLAGSLCQHHPDGRRMFQHRNLRKWKLHGGNPPIEGFLEEETCLRYLDELKATWNGRIFWPPAYDPEMRDLEKQLTAQRFFRLETVSISAETVEFLPGNLLRSSHGPPACWWLSREGPRIVLFLGEDWVINRRFDSYGACYWRSSAIGANEQDLVLASEDDPVARRPRGHNSLSISSAFRSWKKNYENLSTAEGESS